MSHRTQKTALGFCITPASQVLRCACRHQPQDQSVYVSPKPAGLALKQEISVYNVVWGVVYTVITYYNDLPSWPISARELATTVELQVLPCVIFAGRALLTKAIYVDAQD